jgi:hypothetical protein
VFKRSPVGVIDKQNNSVLGKESITTVVERSLANFEVRFDGVWNVEWFDLKTEKSSCLWKAEHRRGLGAGTFCVNWSSKFVCQTLIVILWSGISSESQPPTRSEMAKTASVLLVGENWSLLLSSRGRGSRLADSWRNQKKRNICSPKIVCFSDLCGTGRIGRISTKHMKTRERVQTMCGKREN